MGGGAKVGNAKYQRPVRISNEASSMVSKSYNVLIVHQRNRQASIQRTLTDIVGGTG
jgi:F0F1-type ATP synthase gamma subunit